MKESNNERPWTPTVRKAQCCWTCKHGQVSVDYDDPYTVRCVLKADPSTDKPEYDWCPPGLDDDTDFDSDEIQKKMDEWDYMRWGEEYKWERERPEVDYGGICDDFEDSDEIKVRKPPFPLFWHSLKQRIWAFHIHLNPIFKKASIYGTTTTMRRL